MTWLILLFLLISTQPPIQRFWLGIQLVDLKMLKWDQYPFRHNVFVISLGCRGTPTLLDDPLCWKLCCSWFLPDNKQASTVSLLARGCGLLITGRQRRVLLEPSKMGISISNFIRWLYHGCVGQLGKTSFM